VASLFRGRAEKPSDVPSDWRPEPLDVRLCLIRTAAAATKGSEASDAAMGWGTFALGGVEVISIPGHGAAFNDRDMPEIAATIAKLIGAE
jgi:hypothetical protein